MKFNQKNKWISKSSEKSSLFSNQFYNKRGERAPLTYTIHIPNQYVYCGNILLFASHLFLFYARISFRNTRKFVVIFFFSGTIFIFFVLCIAVSSLLFRANVFSRQLQIHFGFYCNNSFLSLQINWMGIQEPKSERKGKRKWKKNIRALL